ncbi:uncharacterized protein si:ch211-67f13.7 isoform X2 [Puntigrus tetrazona]|uniref:uncharacterized protein si:ch211-67f13.7 isoform X2 n=1 Tax=Puntigrus tetrazona TaxID=1606681 RepID=UPI001C898DB9|nr:uncharacterized protein si:ch211-67f13.7 isoform X2 [Puntigrus tetrazona]
MKVKCITRVVLCLITGIFSSPTLLNSVSASSLLDKRTAREKLAARDPFTNAPGLARQRPAPVLRIIGRAPPTVPPGEHHPLKYSQLPDVSVICSRSEFVLRVKRHFYGFSAAAEELTLGETCKSNGVLEPHDGLLFTYALTDCQGERQGTACAQSGESWSSPVRSAVYLLGQQVNVQVSTRHHNRGVQLFINSCYAAATVNTLSQASKHGIIDNYGCLRESRMNSGASRFRFSGAENVVQFSFGAFQFIEAPDAKVALHCELSVSADGPSPTQKSCFYSHTEKRWISVFGQDSVCHCCESVCNQTKTKRITNEGFVSSDQVLYSDPVTSPFSTLPSSTLESNPMAHRNDDDIWFEDKLTKEHQRSYTHKDFVGPVTLSSSEEDHDKRPHTAEFIEEEEKHGDVEIFMAISTSTVESEKLDIEPMEQLDVASLDWFEERKMQNMTSSYSPKKVQRVEVLQKDKGSTNTSVIVNKTIEEHLDIDESRVGEGQLDEVFLPSFISDSKNKKEGLRVPLFSTLEEKPEFQLGSDELIEQGVVRNLDLARDSDDDYFSDGIE